MKKMKKTIKYILVAMLMLLVANLVIAGLAALIPLPNIFWYILMIVCAWQVGAWLGRRL